MFEREDPPFHSPGAEANGLVAPRRVLPVLTASLPSQTMAKTGPEFMYCERRNERGRKSEKNSSTGWQGVEADIRFSLYVIRIFALGTNWILCFSLTESKALQELISVQTSPPFPQELSRK